MLPISSASPSHFPPNIGAGLSQALVLIILSEPCGCQEPQSDQEPALGVLGLKYKIPRLILTFLESMVTGLYFES